MPKKKIFIRIQLLMKKIFFLLLLALYSNTFAQWININSPQFSEIAVSGNNIFGVEENGIYSSTNNGTNWTLTSLNIPGLLKIAADGSNIFVGTSKKENRGIYRSTNSGVNWTHVLLPTELYAITAIAVSGNEIYTTTGLNFYHSTNNGTNWVHTTNSFFTYSLAISGTTIFAGAEATGVYFSTSGGTNWTLTSLGNRNILAIKINGTNIFAGTETGVYLSTNSGTNWVQTSLNNRYITSLEISGEISGTNIFAATDNGVYLSKNNGTNWQQKNEGLSGGILDGSHLAASNISLFVSNINSTTYRRDISEIISVRQISEIIPKEYKLSQNYPNPFNPTTKINFSIPQKSFVTLKIYNLIGEEAAVLVNEQLSEGVYEYLLNAALLPSGTYFYKMETENFKETKLMILLK